MKNIKESILGSVHFDIRSAIDKAIEDGIKKLSRGYSSYKQSINIGEYNMGGLSLKTVLDKMTVDQWEKILVRGWENRRWAIYDVIICKDYKLHIAKYSKKEWHIELFGGGDAEDFSKLINDDDSKFLKFNSSQTDLRKFIPKMVEHIKSNILK